MILKDSCVVAAMAVTSVVTGFSPVPASRGMLAANSQLFDSTERRNDLFVDATSTQSSVREYYGKTLRDSDDLATNACCAAASPPSYIRECIDNIHPTVKSKYYGCGLCLPQYDITGARVLDLGCGAGRDVSLFVEFVPVP
jgi:hypothetical protein